MKKLFMLFVALVASVSMLFAADAASKVWTIAGVESTQSKVVFNNYPVLLGAGSAGGSWVLNSTEASYAKTATTWVTTGNAKTLQLGSSSISPAGTSLTLAADANPIPANATVTAVEVLVKSLNTESVWAVSVNGVKAAASVTAPSATAMSDCTSLRFENLALQGNLVGISLESVATSGRYVYIAEVKVEYTASATAKEKVAQPSFSPASGASVEAGTAIEVSSATAGAVMHCSVGSSAFAEYPDGKVVIAGAVGSTVSVRAYATKDGMDDSDMASATYTIVAPAQHTPYTETFDSSSALNAWTIIDADADRTMWKYYSGDGSVYIEHQIGNTGKDDWLISPAISLEAGSSYALRFDVRAGNAAYPEKIAVACGTAPTAEAMNIELVPATIVDYAEYRTIMCRMIPSESGPYHIGFHAVSDAGKYRLFIDNVRVSAGTIATAPDVVSDIVIVNSPDGLNKADISFKAPLTALSGESLELLTKIEVLRNGTLIKQFENPVPGVQLSFTDETTEPAEYIYSFVAYNSSGCGADAEVKAYVGINIPQAPSDAVFVEVADGEVSLTWTAPDKTVYGDALNPNLVRYIIRDNDGNILAENIEGTTWQSKIVPDGEQILTGFKVYASTTAGINNSDFAATEVLPVGTPYELPFKESFTRWMPSTIAEYLTPEGSSGSWRAMRELITTGVMAVDGDDGILAFFADYTGDEATYRTGKIAIPAEAADAMLAFYLYNDPENGGKINVTVESAGVSPLTVQIAPEWNGWKEQLVDLKDFAGKTIRVSFTAIAGTLANVTAIDLVEVKSIATSDLTACRFRVPLEMDLLMPHVVHFDITNTGRETAQGYTVDLLCDGEIIDSSTPPALERNESLTLSFTLSPAIDESKTYSAVINYEADGNTADNISEEITPSIITPLYAPVENLMANEENGAIVLSWTAPLASSNTTPVTETFERYDEFVIDNAGEWTFYDVDGGDTYGINDKIHSFPNMAQPMAFIVFNGTIPTIETIGSMTFDAHSGNQYLASFSIQGGETVNNDWLVSPLLNGAAQTVSFFIRSMSIGAHEKFEFLISTTGKSMANFTKFGEGEDYASQWTKFEYQIPEGTKYFAIRCVSFDQYAFFLDDITYTPAATDIDAIAGYDIYRDGVKLNEEPVAATTFTDSAAAAGKHAYDVYAVMPRGLSPSASVSLETSGVENISVTQSVEVYNLQGNRLDTDLDKLPSGIYIIRRGNTIEKIRL